MDIKEMIIGFILLWVLIYSVLKGVELEGERKEREKAELVKEIEKILKQDCKPIN